MRWELFSLTLMVYGWQCIFNPQLRNLCMGYIFGCDRIMALIYRDRNMKLLHIFNVHCHTIIEHRMGMRQIGRPYHREGCDSRIHQSNNLHSHYIIRYINRHRYWHNHPTVVYNVRRQHSSSPYMMLRPMHA